MNYIMEEKKLLEEIKKLQIRLAEIRGKNKLSVKSDCERIKANYSQVIYFNDGIKNKNVKTCDCDIYPKMFGRYIDAASFKNAPLAFENVIEKLSNGCVI